MPLEFTKQGPVALQTARARWARDFTFLWMGSATSQLGNASVATASPLLALSLDGSVVFAGWVAAAGTLPGLLLNLPAGLLADHVQGKRRLMLTSQLIRLCNALALLLALIYSDSPQAFLIAAAAVDGICASFYSITEITVIRELVPRKHLQSAMAKTEARHHVALILGRPLGGFLYGLGHTSPYLFGTLTSFLSLASIVLARAEGRPAKGSDPESAIKPEHKRPNFGLQLMTGWQSLRGNFFLCYVITVCALANFFFQMIILLLLVQAQDQGYSSTQIGLLLASSGVSGFAGALVAPRVMRDRSPKRATFVCFWIWVTLVWCVWAADSAWIGLIAWGLCSFLGAHVNIALAMYQATCVPRDVLGRVVSLTRFLTSGAVSLGALCAGYAIELLNTDHTALLAALAMSAVMVSMSRRLTAAEPRFAVRPCAPKELEPLRSRITTRCDHVEIADPDADYKRFNDRNRSNGHFAFPAPGHRDKYSRPSRKVIRSTPSLQEFGGTVRCHRRWILPRRIDWYWRSSRPTRCASGGRGISFSRL